MEAREMRGATYPTGNVTPDGFQKKLVNVELGQRVGRRSSHDKQTCWKYG